MKCKTEQCTNFTTMQHIKTRLENNCNLHTISRSKAQVDSDYITYIDNLFKTAIHTCYFVFKLNILHETKHVYKQGNGRYIFQMHEGQ